MARTCHYKLSDEQWKAAEILAQLPGRTFTDIANKLGIDRVRPDNILKRCITQRTKLDPEVWLQQRSQVGCDTVREAMFRDACDGKHPITQIFWAKNFLNMRDEKHIITPPDTDKSQQLLTMLDNITKRISKSPTNIHKLEQQNKKIEDAIYTEITVKQLQPTDNTQ